MSGSVGEGRLAQWLERLVHTEEVGGSSPPSPTMWLGPCREYGRTPVLLAISPSLIQAEVAKRQTRCVQGAVPKYGRVGSNPTLGTIHSDTRL